MMAGTRIVSWRDSSAPNCGDRPADPEPPYFGRALLTAQPSWPGTPGEPKLAGWPFLHFAVLHMLVLVFMSAGIKLEQNRRQRAVEEWICRRRQASRRMPWMPKTPLEPCKENLGSGDYS